MDREFEPNLEDERVEPLLEEDEIEVPPPTIDPDERIEQPDDDPGAPDEERRI